MKKLLFFTFIIALILLSSSCIGKRRRIAVALTETADASSQIEVQVETASAPEEEPTTANQLVGYGGIVLFKDDFQDGTPDNWNIISGWDIQQDGDTYYFASSVLGSAWVPGGHSWEDYVFRATLRVDNGVASLNYRLTQDGRYLITFSQDGLYLLKEKPVGSITVLTRVEPVSLGNWHWVTIAGEGEHILVYVDQTLRIDFQDTDPLYGGTIAVGAANATNVMVDDIMVTKPQMSLPPFNASISPPVSNVEAPEIAGPDLADLPSADEVVEDIVQQELAGPAQVAFTIEGSKNVNINPGDCITVAWNVSNALGVYFQGNAVNANGFIDDCPNNTSNYVIEVVDFNGNISEYVVTANVSGGEIEAGLPELSMSVDFSEPRSAGQPFTVVLHIHNAGSVDSGFFTAVWFSAPDVVGCSVDVSVPAGEIIDSVCTFPGYSESGMHEWSAMVDAENEVHESNEDNNTGWGGVSVQ